jgi:hypothetical protein
VKAGDLTIQDGGVIRSTTYSNGDAGKVHVDVNTLTIDNRGSVNFTGILSRAYSGNGKGGDVTVTAKESVTLTNGARISSSSSSTSDAGTVSISSPFISLSNNASITTTAKTGNGGDITINADKLINLQNSSFKTSVDKDSGHGGDITVSAHTLIMNNAAIQANADGGSGGDINLKLQALIPSQYHLLIGGTKVNWQPYQQGFNVIQAASQSGVSGSVNVTSPKLNISGDLVGLNSTAITVNLENNPCQNDVAHGSSLARGGKGGMPSNEAKAVFVPAIIEPILNLQSKFEALDNKPLAANLLAEKSSPCSALSTN